MKVKKSGRCHNLVLQGESLGEFLRQLLFLGLVFLIFAHFVYIAHWQNSYVEALCLCVVNDLATNNHTGFHTIFIFLLTGNSDLTINQPKSSAAALLGWNSLASALSVSPLLCSGLLQVNSWGYSSCSGLSMCVLPALCFAPLITPSRPRPCSTIPIFHLLLLRSFPLISITFSSGL